MEGPLVPLFIRLGNRARQYIPEIPVPGVGSLENVTISNITACNTGKVGCAIVGIPGHPVRNIHLSNLVMEFPGGVDKPVNPEAVPELEDHYPEATMFGLLPAYALYIRHAENISISNSRAWCRQEDSRPALYTEDVVGLDLNGWVAKNKNTSGGSPEE